MIANVVHQTHKRIELILLKVDGDITLDGSLGEACVLFKQRKRLTRRHLVPLAERPRCARNR